jgi:hypothetical protein
MVSICTPTKSNLHFPNYLTTGFNEPVLYSLLTFNFQNCISIFWCLGRVKECVQVLGPIECFETNVYFTLGVVSPRPNPSWTTTPCRLSATAYSIYSQLSSILCGGRFLHPQPEDAPWHGDRRHT